MLTVAAFYRFTPIADRQATLAALRAICAEAETRGTILVADEGINGTIAGTAAGVAHVIDALRRLPGCEGLTPRYSTAAAMPFGRMKVRLKQEIVSMGQPHIDPAGNAGTRVAPADWNALIADPDTVVIDTRNAYEVEVGSFTGAIDPKTPSFRDFPTWWRAHAADFAGKRIAMFCTGGIRCEKSTAFLRAEGVSDVYHLDGGILAYLDAVPEGESRWQGECFVFDERVSLGHGLVERREAGDAEQAASA